MIARTRRLQWIVVAGLASVFVATSASAQTNPRQLHK